MNISSFSTVTRYRGRSNLYKTTVFNHCFFDYLSLLLFLVPSVSFQISKLPGGTQNKIGQVAGIVLQIRVSMEHRTTGRTSFLFLLGLSNVFDLFVASLYLPFFEFAGCLNMPFQAPSGTSRGV